MKRIFVYTPEAKLPKKMIAEIEAAGYICVKTPNFDAVKIIEPIPDVDASLVASKAVSLIMESPSYLDLRKEFTKYVTKLVTKPFQEQSEELSTNGKT